MWMQKYIQYISSSQLITTLKLELNTDAKRALSKLWVL